jgi:hypothetical protein
MVNRIIRIGEDIESIWGGVGVYKKFYLILFGA